jgi:hypothetical protein
VRRLNGPFEPMFLGPGLQAAVVPPRAASNTDHDPPQTRLMPHHAPRAVPNLDHNPSQTRLMPHHAPRAVPNLDQPP